jgi:hypothetical protein
MWMVGMGGLHGIGHDINAESSEVLEEGCMVALFIRQTINFLFQRQTQ